MASIAERQQYNKPNSELVQLLKSLPEAPPFQRDVDAMRKANVERRRNRQANIPLDLSGVVENDIEIPSRDSHTIPARVYRPVSAPSDGGSPLVVMLHGGGFVMGDVESEQPDCRLFSKNLDAVCVNVVYRLAPEHPFPAAVNDSWDAVKWVAANATSKLGADPSKGFIVGGASAGGNLADVVGHLARDEKLFPPLTGLLELVPPLCPYEVMPEKYRHFFTSHIDNKDAVVLPQQVVNFFVEQYKPDLQSELYAPFNWPTGHSGLPPIAFQVCGADLLRDEALIYEKVLREEYGVKTLLSVYPGLPHTFWSFFPTMESSKKFVKETLESLTWLLEQKLN